MLDWIKDNSTAFAIAVVFHLLFLAALLVNCQMDKPDKIVLKQGDIIQVSAVDANSYDAEVRKIEQKKKAEQRKKVQAKRKAQELAKKKKQEEIRKKKEKQGKADELKRKKAAVAKKKKEALKKAEQEKKRKKEADKKRQPELKRKEQRDRAEREIVQKIERNWRQPLEVPSRLECKIEIVLLPSGNVVAVKVVESSGNQAFDRSVETAVRKASPLPVPTDSVIFKEFEVMRLRFEPGSY
ncbi:MAG: cell envelope integrity protein TolA [Thiohalomonas sp.]|nr:cell envelope integrity protein TolA [Thiohalomonas sp.]